MFYITYSRKLWLKAQLKYWGVLCGLLAILFLDIKYGIGKINFTTQTIQILISSLFGFVFYPVFIGIKNRSGKIADKLLDDAYAARLGFEGERTIADWLKKILPQNSFRVLPNITLPGHKFDIDFIIIGPKGVIVLEVKNFTEQVKFLNDKYYLFFGGKWLLLSSDQDPRDEADRHSYYLKKYFERNAINNVKISRAVVFLKDTDALIKGKTGIYIANGFDSLKRFIEGVTEDSRYDASFCNRIENVLENKS